MPVENINITAPNASETVKGFVEEATQAELNAGTDTGGTGAKLFTVPSKILSLLSSYQTISGLFTSVMGLVLTGFTAGANTAIAATDTLAQALAKIQGQINARVVSNGSISADTKTKITYDSKGLVTGGADATTADIADSTDKRYVTDAQRTVIGNTSGTNTGDETAARIATINHGTSAKTTLVDADELTGQDSANSFSLIRVTCLNVYNYLKGKFDTVYANLASPTFTGTPAAPTATAGTNTTQLATTAFVKTAVDAKSEFFGVAMSDETTVLGTASTTVPFATMHVPYAMTLTQVFAGLRTAGTGAAVVTVDIHLNGTTIMTTTKILFTASVKLSANGTLTTTALAAGDYLEFFLDQRDTNNVATGLKCYLIGHQ